MVRGMNDQAKSIEGVQNIAVSTRLRGFIKSEFKKLGPEIKRLKEEKIVLKRQKDKERKDSKGKNLEVKLLDSLKRRGMISDENYQDVKNEILFRPSSLILAKSPWLRGKGLPDFYTFVVTCYRLIKAENPKIKDIKDIMVYRWIAKFLDSKKHRKANGRAYSDNDIKRIIYFYDTDRGPMRKLGDLLIDDGYRRYKPILSK